MYETNIAVDRDQRRLLVFSSWKRGTFTGQSRYDLSVSTKPCPLPLADKTTNTFPGLNQSHNVVGVA